MNEEKDLIFFKVKGTSMRPFFKTGDMFIVQKTDAEDLKIGDIISYQRKAIICHRLIKKVRCNKSYVLQTRGDTQVKSEEVIEEKDLIGKVIAVIRNGRITNLSSPFQQFINRLIVIFLPFTLRVYNKIKQTIPFLRNRKFEIFLN